MENKIIKQQQKAITDLTKSLDIVKSQKADIFMEFVKVKFELALLKKQIVIDLKMNIAIIKKQNKSFYLSA